MQVKKLRARVRVAHAVDEHRPVCVCVCVCVRVCACVFVFVFVCLQNVTWWFET